jgi:hypothetical protein
VSNDFEESEWGSKSTNISTKKAPSSRSPVIGLASPIYYRQDRCHACSSTRQMILNRFGRLQRKNLLLPGVWLDQFRGKRGLKKSRIILRSPP